MFDWDDLRLFLAVARARRIAAAARGLNLDPTTIGRRLARLESALGAPLFEGAGGERRLTERGQALLAHAESIESSALAALGEVSGDSARLSGLVRISVPEGFASWLLAPRLGEFRAQNPHIRLDLVTASGFLNPSKREADIAVMLARPRAARLVSSRLGGYPLRLYASADYLERRGRPERIEDLGTHALIGYVPEFLYAPELDYLPELGVGLEPSMRSTSINMQHQWIANGVGIGVLPEFIARRDPRLTAVMPDHVEIRRSFWLVMHGEVRRLARIQATAGWIRECARGLS